MGTSDQPSNQYIPVLDGLRAGAILAVIVCHVNQAYGGPFMAGVVNGSMAMVLGWGWVGVDLFFVLSGFLITGILYDSKGSRGYFRNFYARRALRIMPLYYGFLFLTTVIFPWLSDGFFGRLLLLHDISPADARSLYLYYYNFYLPLTGRMLYDFHHFWSLAIEEHFYLVWPLVIYALNRRSLMRTCLGMAVGSFFLRVIVIVWGTQPISAFFLTPLRLDGLLIGSWVALARRDRDDWFQLRRYAGWLTSGSGGLLLGIALGQRHFIPGATPERTAGVLVNGDMVLTVGIAALAIFFAGFMVLTLETAQGSQLRSLLEGNWLRAIGKYSYGMYVFHGVILLATVRLVSPLNATPAYIAKPIAVLWITTVTFFVAWLSYHLYEKQFLRLKAVFRTSAIPRAILDHSTQDAF